MADIIELLERRDEEALVLLKKYYSDYCYSIINRILQNHEESEEALSDVWLRIWNCIPPARPQRIRPYLAKTARNIALDYIKHSNAEKRRGITLLLDEIAEVLPDTSTEHDDQNQMLKESLNRFLHSLGEEEQRIFLRRYWYGASIEEISSDLGYSQSKITGILCRTRKKLRKHLEKEDYKV